MSLSSTIERPSSAPSMQPAPPAGSPGSKNAVRARRHGTFALSNMQLSDRQATGFDALATLSSSFNIMADDSFSESHAPTAFDAAAPMSPSSAQEKQEREMAIWRHIQGLVPSTAPMAVEEEWTSSSDDDLPLPQGFKQGVAIRRNTRQLYGLKSMRAILRALSQPLNKRTFPLSDYEQKGCFQTQPYWPPPLLAAPTTAPSAAALNSEIEALKQQLDEKTCYVDEEEEARRAAARSAAQRKAHKQQQLYKQAEQAPFVTLSLTQHHDAFNNMFAQEEPLLSDEQIAVILQQKIDASVRRGFPRNRAESQTAHSKGVVSLGLTTGRPSGDLIDREIQDMLRGRAQTVEIGVAKPPQHRRPSTACAAARKIEQIRQKIKHVTHDNPPTGIYTPNYAFKDVSVASTQLDTTGRDLTLSVGGLGKASQLQSCTRATLRDSRSHDVDTPAPGDYAPIAEQRVVKGVAFAYPKTHLMLGPSNAEDFVPLTLTRPRSSIDTSRGSRFSGAAIDSRLKLGSKIADLSTPQISTLSQQGVSFTRAERHRIGNMRQQYREQLRQIRRNAVKEKQYQVQKIKHRAERRDTRASAAVSTAVSAAPTPRNAITQPSPRNLITQSSPFTALSQPSPRPATAQPSPRNVTAQHTPRSATPSQPASQPPTARTVSLASSAPAVAVDAPPLVDDDDWSSTDSELLSEEEHQVRVYLRSISDKYTVEALNKRREEFVKKRDEYKQHVFAKKNELMAKHEAKTRAIEMRGDRFRQSKDDVEMQLHLRDVQRHWFTLIAFITRINHYRNVVKMGKVAIVLQLGHLKQRVAQRVMTAKNNWKRLVVRNRRNRAARIIQRFFKRVVKHRVFCIRQDSVPILIRFLQDCSQRNRVKKIIQQYRYMIVKIQKWWRRYIHVPRARMVYLSCLWDATLRNRGEELLKYRQYLSSVATAAAKGTFITPTGDIHNVSRASRSKFAAVASNFRADEQEYTIEKFNVFLRGEQGSGKKKQGREKEYYMRSDIRRTGSISEIIESGLESVVEEPRNDTSSASAPTHVDTSSSVGNTIVFPGDDAKHRPRLSFSIPASSAAPLANNNNINTANPAAAQTSATTASSAALSPPPKRVNKRSESERQQFELECYLGLSGNRQMATKKTVIKLIYSKLSKLHLNMLYHNRVADPMAERLRRKAISFSSSSSSNNSSFSYNLSRGLTLSLCCAWFHLASYSFIQDIMMENMMPKLMRDALGSLNDVIVTRVDLMKYLINDESKYKQQQLQQLQANNDMIMNNAQNADQSNADAQTQQESKKNNSKTNVKKKKVVRKKVASISLSASYSSRRSSMNSEESAWAFS